MTKSEIYSQKLRCSNNNTKSTHKNMKKFTLFTLLYVAMGVYFTIIAFQQPGMVSRLKVTLLLLDCLTYLAAVLSTFPFWHQTILRNQRRLSDKPAWKQNLVMFVPLILPLLLLVQFIISLLTYGWLAQTTLNFCLFLFILVVSVENIFVRSQARQ